MPDSTQGAMEPPTMSPTVPFVGHIIGLMRSKFNYYVQLSQRTTLPIFSMHMPGTTMYIVTTPHLIQAIQKLPKTLAFPPIEAKFSNRICGVSKEAHEILMKNVNGDEGDWGLSMESYAAMRAALVPGSGLDEMNRIMMEDVATAMNSILPPGDKEASFRIGLNDWLRDRITTATTNAVYGPQNPFKDKTVRDAFWDFEKDLVTILAGILPSLTARKGLAGRAKVVSAFEQFFRNKGHEQASLLLRNRYETSARNGVSIKDISRYEVGGAVAILVNTAPAAFWTLLYVYSNPAVLEDVRAEVYSVATKQDDGNGVSEYSLDITTAKTGCPFLASTLQEVLRLRTVGTSIRQVMEDTVLDGQWLLKKDAMIQMPSRIIHTDGEIWGPSVDDFNPRRFLRDTNAGSQSKRPTAAAFRAFGGGTTLCPGRHFATNEVLACVVMMVMQYDLEPAAGSWEMPPCYNTNVAAVVMEPDTDIAVDISRRANAAREHWTFALKDSDKVMALAVEDGPQ